MAFFNEDYVQFFKDLAPNNNKDWFDINRKRYEGNVRDPFKAFTQHIISELAKNDKRYADTEAKDCMFRVNRDIRFSKDKTPYKLNMSAYVSPLGRKNKHADGVYFELTPEHVRVYGGVYESDTEQLYTIREGMIRDLSKFQKAYSEKVFKSTFGEILGEKNKVIPKEFKEAGEKEPLIYNKQWYFYAQFEPELITDSNLDKVILKAYEAGRPVQELFNKWIKR